MERQKNMADLNNEKEIDFFSTLITDLRYVWQDKEVSEILTRVAIQVLGLGNKARELAKEAGCLGSLRQEFSSSKTVSVMVEYVELLNEMKSDIHEELLNARKVLGDNNIAIEKTVETDPEVNIKTRSVSLVYPVPAGRKVSYQQEERSKSVTEREIFENNNEVRKKSKQRKMFATISEICDKDEDFNIKDAPLENILKKRKKSSKKVSIAENLNCDYSDTNVSDHDSMNTKIETINNAKEQRYEVVDKTELLPNIVFKMLDALLLHICYISQQPFNTIICIIFLIIIVLLYYYNYHYC